MHNFLYVDSGFLKRYKMISKDKGSEDEMGRIEVLVAWKIIHELAHLAFRWEHGEDKATPKKLGYEAGEYVEKRIMDGLGGFIYSGDGQWTGEQKILGLYKAVSTLTVVKKGKKAWKYLPFRITDWYIRLACQECLKSDCPVIKKLVDVEVEGNAFVERPGLWEKSALPEVLHDMADSCCVDSEVELVESIEVGKNMHAVIPRCGKYMWKKLIPGKRATR
jgi:hypothetical protein